MKEQEQIIEKSAEKAWRELSRLDRGLPFVYVHGIRHPLPVGLTCSLHDHPVVELVYHRSGSGYTRLADGREVAFGEGSCVLYGPRVAHDQIMEKAGEDWCVLIALPKRFDTRLRGCLVVPETEPWVAAEIDHLSRPPFLRDLGVRNVLDLRATAVLLAILRRRSHLEEQTLLPAERHVRKAERYLRQHFAEIDSVNEVAAHIELSPDRLRHLFKERRGVSLVGFLNQVRVEHARSLLEHTGLPLKQVATLCGFRDEYYFSTVFRRVAGRPPGAYRQQRV